MDRRESERCVSEPDPQKLNVPSVPAPDPGFGEHPPPNLDGGSTMTPEEIARLERQERGRRDE